MNLINTILCLLLLQGHYISMTVTPDDLHPGSPFILNISGLVTDTSYNISFDKHVVSLSGVETAHILLGVDLNHPYGNDQIKLYGSGGSYPITITTIQIHSHSYPSQYLKLPPGFVELTPEELARVIKEQHELDQIFANYSTKPMWKGSFIMPVHGIITTPFGVKRFLNGEPRAPHTGIDIAGKLGTPIMATNNGIVCFTGSLFFGGNSIIIDHGQGIYSMYFHLDRYAVKEGQYVRKGQVIGYMGATGRVTGTSLHFGIRIVDSKIDPELLFNLTKKL